MAIEENIYNEDSKYYGAGSESSYGSSYGSTSTGDEADADTGNEQKSGDYVDLESIAEAHIPDDKDLLSEDDLKKNISLFSEDIVINGDVDAKCPVVIKCKVTGNVKSTSGIVVSGNIKGLVSGTTVKTHDATIVGDVQAAEGIEIGLNSKINGNISGESVVVDGSVHGNITATKSIKFGNDAVVLGDIKADVFSIPEGAKFEGNVSILSDKSLRDYFKDELDIADTNDNSESKNDKFKSLSLDSNL